MLTGLPTKGRVKMLLFWLPLALVAGAPNVIYVVVDDLDQMLGSSFPQTTAATPLPKTKRLLVDEGGTFTNAFAHVPICNPSRAATLTGKYFHNLKATGALRAMHVDMDKVHDFSFAVDFKRADQCINQMVAARLRHCSRDC